MEILINCLKAFFVGGAICLVGQILIDYTKLTPARILVSFVVAGVFLSGVGVYGPLVEFAGVGATVPLTGFGHVLAQGVKEAVDQRGIFGALLGGLSASALGISTAILTGFIMSLIFKSGDRTTD